MFEVLPTLAAGALFGLALAAPPGPMNAVIAEESVLRGWVAGAKAGLGAGLADFAFFLLAVGGVVGFVQRYPAVQGALFGVGGLLMLYYAVGAAAGARSSFAPVDVDAEEGTGVDGARGEGASVADRSTGFRRAFVLALSNPYQILFWLTVGVGLLEPGRLDVLAEAPYIGASLSGVLVVETGSVALVAGLFGGVGLWLLAFPATLVTVGRRVESFAPVVAVGSALTLAGFGVSYLLAAWRTFA